MKMWRTFVLIISFAFMAMKCFASENVRLHLHLSFSPDTTVKIIGGEIPDSVSSSNQFHLTENKRIVAAILAFPPFGCLGLHRIYLGTDPWVPVVYVLTLGGCGLIALADFVEICTADDATFSSYSHNSKVFMWGK